MPETSNLKIKTAEAMWNRARQKRKRLADWLGFAAACLLALALAIGFNWAIFDDWFASFPAVQSIRIKSRAQQVGDSLENSAEQQSSNPMDASIQINRAPGNFF